MPFAIHHGRTFSSIFRSIRQAFSSILTLLSTSRLASGELLASHGRTDLKEIAVYQSAVRMPMPCCPTVKLHGEAAGRAEIV
ncbi:hypothetical protein H6F96_28180 [Microcoleus sp. FACHB-53]|nr:hypothetical protein [Microcoleus sp. FACHB-53]